MKPLMKVTAFIYFLIFVRIMHVISLSIYTVLCQCKLFAVTSYLQKLTTTIICQMCHYCSKSYWTLNPHSLSIFYFIVRASALGVITVAYLSISGHAHNSVSCNLVIKQLTFPNYSRNKQTMNMDICILVTGEEGVGKTELINSFARSSNNVSCLFRFWSFWIW